MIVSFFDDSELSKERRLIGWRTFSVSVSMVFCVLVRSTTTLAMGVVRRITAPTLVVGPFVTVTIRIFGTVIASTSAMVPSPMMFAMVIHTVSAARRVVVPVPILPVTTMSLPLSFLLYVIWLAVVLVVVSSFSF